MKTIVLSLLFFLISCSPQSREEKVAIFFEEIKKTEKHDHDLKTASRVAKAMIRGRPDVSSVHAGPLGLRKGLTPDEIKSIVKVFKIRNRPNDLPIVNVSGMPKEIVDKDFFYILKVSEISGLCSILGLAQQRFETKEGANALKSFFEVIEQDMIQNYGHPNIEKGWALSYWGRPDLWVYSGDKKNRLVYKEWNNPSQSGVMKQTSVRRAAVSINHHQYSSNQPSQKFATLEIYYEFDNYDDCAKQEKAILP